VCVKLVHYKNNIPNISRNFI